VIGVYGVVSYSVAQQTHEIGVRIAVGATRGDIAAMVLKEGLLLAAIGLVVGLAGVFAMTRFLRTLLFEITPTDPGTLLLVTGLLLMVTAVAIAIPLRRATRVDPMVALRYE
jgi:putative ABC transport system permease protein